MTSTPIRTLENRSQGLAGGVSHYENFPVASWLCPAALRAPVAAIYHFARTADDLADEGDASTAERLSSLARYRSALERAADDAEPDSAAWPQVFVPLQLALREHHLPVDLLHDLLSAFEQDVRHTGNAHRYAHRDELLAYCRLSANPVGRLLLHLYGVDDSESLQRSDLICSSLQLINFWQDLSVDLPRQRHYLPSDLLAAHGLEHADFDTDASRQDSASEQARQDVVAELCRHARGLMLQGAPLVHRLPGRAGWELRLVVQGGLRILDRIAQLEHRSWRHRPTVGRADVPLLLWRSLRM